MHSTLLPSVVSALLLSHSAAGVVVQPRSPAAANVTAVTLDIVNTQLAPDGFMRSVITANGTYPGPLITATKGDLLMVTVNDKLDDSSMRLSTSMDFDGVMVDTSNAWQEGTPFVTTCPIAPNSSFTYALPLLPTQSGTFWYHSQLSVQYVDGLRGPLIIYDPDDPLADMYDVDDESTIIQIGDWWHNTSTSLLAHYVATGIVPVSDSGTTNGVGRYIGGPEVPWSVINVTTGKRYRFRLINQSARNVFTMSFESHNVTIIETDGVATQPLVVDELEMLAGQRYSVVLTADQPVGNYWINAPFVGGDPANNPLQNGTNSGAILRYEGAPAVDPAGSVGAANGVNPLVEANLHPLVADPPPAPDINITLNLVVTTGKAQWNVNNVSYLPPDTPTLVKILNGANSSADFNITENTFVLPPNVTVQVDFPPNDDDEAHPFHLHGNNFWVVKSNSSDIVNTVNPIKRDVSGVGAAGTTVRFTTDNPGPWFFHCHIFWHMQAGLATVMASGLDGVRDDVQPSAAWEALCPAYSALPADQQ